MPSTCVVGMQWGDESKAHVADLLAADADMVVRYQGGNNAGHTVVIGEEVFKLHLVPVGVLRPGKLAVIGNGVVVDPGFLLEEIAALRKRGIEIGDNLKLSDRAHVIFPYHRSLDGASEQHRGGGKIGTTGKGIGPCYSDKMAYTGIRVGDLFNPELFQERLASILEVKNFLLEKFYGVDPLPFQEIYETYSGYAEQLKDYVCDTQRLLSQSYQAGKHLLFEGAQGSLLDVDHGTYPYVTASNGSACGVSAGTGLSPKCVDSIVGVLKAYTTRVGEGPFPSELNDEVGQRLQQKGKEFGTTTGRPRRCGWLDLVACRYTVDFNQVDRIALSKLDVMSGMDPLKVCVGYRFDGKLYENFPADEKVLENAEPVCEELPGWQEDIADCRSFDSLPPQAQDYVRFVQDALKVKIDLVAVGPERDQVIQC